MNVKTSYGINPQSSLMYPCSEECSQVITVCHQGAVVISFKYLAGAKSKKPFSFDISQTIGSSRNDASVCYLKKRRKVLAFTQNSMEEVRNLDNVAGCIAADGGMHQPTYVVEKDGVE